MEAYIVDYCYRIYKVTTVSLGHNRITLPIPQYYQSMLIYLPIYSVGGTGYIIRCFVWEVVAISIQLLKLSTLYYYSFITRMFYSYLYLYDISILWLVYVFCGVNVKYYNGTVLHRVRLFASNV